MRWTTVGDGGRGCCTLPLIVKDVFFSAVPDNMSILSASFALCLVNIPHMNRIFLGTQPGIGCRIEELSTVLNFDVRERGGSPSEG